MKTQTDAEKQFITFLNSLYEEGSKFRKKTTQDWQHSIDIMQGKMWPEKRPSYKVNATMNFLAQVVEKKTALLTDAKPVANVVTRKKGLDEVCQILSKVIDAIFEERGWEQKLTEFVFLEQYFGLSAINTCYDKSLDWGLGDIDFAVLDPRTFVFDPFITRSYNLNSGEYFCFETTRPTNYLQDKYSNKADSIKADFSTDLQMREDSLLSKIRTLFKGKDENKGLTSVIPRSVVRDFWIRDRKTKKDGKLLYPNWREVLVVGGCIVEDGSNPYIDGDLPVDMMEWDFNVNSAYGFNEVNKLEMAQIMFNKVLATIIENATLMGNGIWIGDTNALSDPDKARLSNEPGSHVWKRPGTELRRETGVALPAGLTQILTLLLGGIEKLSSITEAMEGRKPGQVTAGTAIESMQIAASTVIRLKARQIEALVQRIGQKLISRIFQYYTEDRVFNLTGKADGFTQFVYERSKIREAIQKTNGTMLTAFKDFQYKVVPASSLALTKWQKGLIAMQLYQAKAIDRQALLEAVEYPNWEKILDRTIEKQQSGEEPIQTGKGQKLPKSVLRGGNKETGFQHPQKGKQ